MNFTDSSPIEREELALAFSAAGLGEPEVCATAPGRVNVIGEHIDYNGGLVLPAAIDRWTSLCLKRRDDDRVRICSAHQGCGPVEFSLSDLRKSDHHCWSNYPKGVLAGLIARGVAVSGFDAMVSTTIPVGGGLSSSAALEAVFGKAVLELANESMDPLDLARLCQRAEHDFAGVPCGLMDQAAVILCQEGKLLLLDCQDETYEYAPFDDPEWGLLIINSRVSHELSDGGYAARRDLCHRAASKIGVGTLREVPVADLGATLRSDFMSDEMRRYVRHAVTEIERTLQAAQALQQRDYISMGRLMNDSHASLRDDYRVSCQELDFIAASAQQLDGVVGCRMTGGGFGGSAIALVRSERVDEVGRTVAEAYRRTFGIEPAVFSTRPMGGVRAWSC